MFKRKVVIGLASFVLITVLVGQSLSGAAGRGGQRPQRDAVQRGGNTGRVQRDPRQMQKQMQNMMVQRMKAQLEIDDEKWETVKPLLENVLQLDGQLNSGTAMGRLGMPGGMGGRGMGQGGPGGRGGPGVQPGQGRNRPVVEGQATTEGEKTALEKAGEELQELLKSSTAESAAIETKLAAYREAKTAVKGALAKAKEALKAQMTTPKQQATLALANMLD
jgi:hypothetical protein